MFIQMNHSKAKEYFTCPYTGHLINSHTGKKFEFETEIGKAYSVRPFYLEIGFNRKKKEVKLRE